MGTIITKEVKTLSDYVSFLRSTQTNHPTLWFRGHSKASYTLQPSIYRPPFSWEDEVRFMHKFKAKAVRFVKTQAASLSKMT